MGNAPGEATASSSAWAGPWLLFKGGTGGDEAKSWRGSVLFLTAAAGAAPAAAPAAAAATAGSQQQGQPADGAPPPPSADGTANGGVGAPHEQPAAAGAAPQPPAAAASQAAAAGAASAAQQPPTLQLTDETASGQHTVKAVQLDVVAGWTFWRFDLQLELTAWQVRSWFAACGRERMHGTMRHTGMSQSWCALVAVPPQAVMYAIVPFCWPCLQRQVQYQISSGGGEATPSFTFCLPAAGQPMHWCGVWCVAARAGLAAIDAWL